MKISNQKFLYFLKSPSNWLYIKTSGNFKNFLSHHCLTKVLSVLFNANTGNLFIQILKLAYFYWIVMKICLLPSIFKMTQNYITYRFFELPLFFNLSLEHA